MARKHSAKMDPANCGMCWLFFNHAIATFAKKDFHAAIASAKKRRSRRR